MKKGKIEYVEPADYFPESIRKKHGLGEYANQDDIHKQRTEPSESECALSPNDLILDDPGTIPFQKDK